MLKNTKQNNKEGKIMDEILTNEFILPLDNGGDEIVEIKERLDQDTKHEPIPSINNYLLVFENDPLLKEKIGYNELSGQPEIIKNQIQWTDFQASEVARYIQSVYGFYNKEAYKNGFNALLIRHKFNPVINMLEKTEWDGKPRIGTILQKYLKCEDNDYTREVARLIFSGGIKRLYEPGCKFDLMPVFIGGQGGGKTTFIQWLALNMNYYNEVKTMDGQKGFEALAGVWICEVGELLALKKTKEVEAVRSFITSRSDNYRKPWDKYPSKNPRRCILLGTSNSKTFLVDKTGNRRYLPIMTYSDARKDLFSREQECKNDILQCWEEARYWYQTQDELLLDLKPEFLDDAQKAQENALEDDWRVGVIRAYLDEHPISTVCTKEIWDEALHSDVTSFKDMSKKDSNEISLIMDSFEDYQRVSSYRTKRYGIQRGWRRKING